MSALISKVVAAVELIIFGVGSLFGSTPAPEPVQFGAALTTIPKVVALFETSLASKITSTATSATLVSGTDKDGTALSGTYGFIIDEGASSEEFVMCSATGTALTSCTRGLSVTDPNTSVTASKHEHRRGASVKITNYPQIGFLTRLANGTDQFPNILSYASHPNFSGAASTSLIDLAYAASLSYAGTVDASLSAKGIVETATTAEINAGTDFGSTGAYLFINPSFFILSSRSLSLDEKNALSGGGQFGTPSTTNQFLTERTASSSTMFLPVVRAYTTGTTAWTKPAGLKYLKIKIYGAGGGSGGVTTISQASQGGGHGGYSEELVVASSLPISVTASIGSGGTAGAGNGGNGGPGSATSFGSIASASGGSGGNGAGPDAGRATDGTGFSGDVNVTGGGRPGGSKIWNGSGNDTAGEAGLKGYIIIEEHYI